MDIKFLRLWMTMLAVVSICNHPALGSPTQDRVDDDIAKGKPIFVQVVVALADNRNQWIVPVPASIGNGQDARSNLYWGARYGLKTYLARDGAWEKVSETKPQDERILERLVLSKKVVRNGLEVPVFLVADAWDGYYIKDAIRQFLNYNAGKDAFSIVIGEQMIFAGGNAHLIAYIGHNALMDYGGLSDLTLSNPKAETAKPDRDAIVLACKSEQYFLARLEQLRSRPLLLTTGLMAPEAYSLHAAVMRWASGGSDDQVKKAAADSYNRYQKAGRKASARLFGIR
jgi:hypothetical protein